MNDAVNSPPHYTRFKGIEVIDITEQLDFCRGNAVKYICRAGFKSKSSYIEDLRKARWYIDRASGLLNGSTTNRLEKIDVTPLSSQMDEKDLGYILDDIGEGTLISLSDAMVDLTAYINSLDDTHYAYL